MNQLPEPDRTTDALWREIEGLKKSDAKWKRKSARLATELADHIAKNGSLRHEIKRLEDLLAWIHKTEVPGEEVKRVIERTIPRRISRERPTT